MSPVLADVLNSHDLHTSFIVVLYLTKLADLTNSSDSLSLPCGARQQLSSYLQSLFSLVYTSCIIRTLIMILNCIRNAYFLFILTWNSRSFSSTFVVAFDLAVELRNDVVDRVVGQSLVGLGFARLTRRLLLEHGVETSRLKGTWKTTHHQLHQSDKA